MNISTAYRQHQQVLSTQAEIAEVRKEIKTVDFAYKVAFVGTFALYFCFIWGMYVADLWGFSTWLSHNISEVAALVVYGVLAVALPLTMALIKEIAYRHFSNYQNNLTMMIMIVGILALAGVVYESITSSSQQQHISHSSAENSKSFEAISKTGNNQGPVTSASLSSLIAAAQQKVARCEEKLKQGKEKHCEGDKAKLQGYLDSEQRAFAAAERVSVAALETKTKAMQDLKEDSFKPVFKAIRDSMNVTIATGIMIVTVFVSAVFEVSHLLLILLGGQKKRRLIGLESNLINLEAGYMEFTGKAFKAEDFADDSVLNMDDVREQSPSPIGFGMPATAQFKYQQEEKKPFGFTPWTNEKQSNGNNKPVSTWNAGLKETGIHSPMDHALNQSADKAQIDRILQRGQQSLDSTRQLGIPSQPSQLDRGLQAISDSLYPAWRRAVKSGECSHAKAATQKFIWKHAGDDVETLTANETGRIWNFWKARGANDGLLVSNPKYSPGNRKPEYVLAHQ